MQVILKFFDNMKNPSENSNTNFRKTNETKQNKTNRIFIGTDRKPGKKPRKNNHKSMQTKRNCFS